MKEKKKSIALDIGGTRIKIAVVTDGTVEDFTGFAVAVPFAFERPFMRY